MKFKLPNFKKGFTLYLRRRQAESKGFTLIELLTVVSIIGILAALLTVSFANVSARSRDSKRKSDIQQIRSALELYKADNDSYPISPTLSTCGVAFVGGLVTYMAKIPCDPKSSAVYFYSSCAIAPCTTYTLASCIENAGDKDKTTIQPGGMGVCTPGYYYVTTNP